MRQSSFNDKSDTLPARKTPPNPRHESAKTMPLFQRIVTVAACAIVAATWMARAPRADAPAGRYTATTVGGTAAVKDNVTGLTWMRNELVGTFDWAGASTGCTGGWRLPSVIELNGIVDYVHTGPPPKIDRTFFQGQTAGSVPTSGEIWSSTAAALRSGNAWYIDFKNGTIDRYPVVGIPIGVRCVR